MGYKVVITGATGMVGKGVLLECLDHELIQNVLVIGRSPVSMEHPKLKEILIEDFFMLDGIKDGLKGFDACFFCLGTTSFQLPEQAYSRITYDLTTTFAKAFLNQNPESVFSYVSGAGTDGSKASRIMWVRVKGRTENTLVSMGFKKAYMFRPGYIQPLRGIKSKTRWIAVLYRTLETIAVCEHSIRVFCRSRRHTPVVLRTTGVVVIGSSPELRAGRLGRSDVLRLRRGKTFPRTCFPWRSHDASCNRSSSDGGRHDRFELGQR